MFCCVAKIVYIFITIFFCCCSFLFYFLYSLLFFWFRKKGHTFTANPSWWAPHNGQRTMKMSVSSGVCGHTHSQRSREPPQMPLLSWKICPFCGLPMPVGGTQREQLAQVFISAFWSIRPALPLCSTTLSLPCLVSTWLCSSALNPQRRQKPAYMNNLFFFLGRGPSFCALMIIGLISFFHRSHCSLLDLNLFGMHRMLALFVFPFPIPLALSFFLLSFTLYFMLLQWGREIV